MQNIWVEKNVFIVVKTYPNSSKKYQETVCTAGITEDGEWIRLYPVQFRSMEKAKQFEKYTWIKVRLKKAKEHREDSYNPDMDSFKILEHIGPDNNWFKRKHIVYPTRSKSIEELESQLITHKKSLGIFKPKEIIDFKITINKKSVRANPISNIQLSLFEEAPKPLENIPYEFRYEFLCDDINCHGHSMIVLDWEIFQAFRSWRHHYGEQGALEQIKKKWFDMMCASKRDTHFIVGTHNRFPTFMILGVFYPEYESQLSLFDFI
ncbi:hypothetical protein P4S95_09190 [Aneurinibacillus aneurinilyticus]|uniref:hypothetical protein n=1 Tax=Aneurinibacillus aneurinilyticus TaxID=1391 RepID=UPI002E1C1310|nr:hypothetical protein [Aneurinibacillus aneurinilyticus]